MLTSFLFASCCWTLDGATLGDESSQQHTTRTPWWTVPTRAPSSDVLTHLVLVQVRAEAGLRLPKSSQFVASRAKEPHGWLQQRFTGRNATIIAHIPKTAISTFINDVPPYLPYGYGLHAQETCMGDLFNSYYQIGDTVMVMLRDPMGHVNSQYTMCCCSSWGQEVTRNHRDSIGNFMNISDWLTHFQTDGTTGETFGCYHPQDMQTRYVSCDSGDAHGYQVPDVKKAVSRLSLPWVFVGVTEYYQESICAFIGRLKDKIPPWCSCDKPNLWNSFSSINKTWGVPSHRVEDLTESEKSKIRALTTEDAKLYSAGMALFLNAVHQAEIKHNIKILCDAPSREKDHGIDKTSQQLLHVSEEDEKASAYSIGEENTNSCPEGYIKIYNPDECKKAVIALGMKIFNDEKYSNDHKPGGCWRGSSGAGNWNPSVGSAMSGTNPVCKAALLTRAAPEAQNILVKNAKIEVVSLSNNTRTCTIMEVGTAQIKIHYDGYDARFDEWLAKDSKRIIKAPTSRYGTQNESFAAVHQREALSYSVGEENTDSCPDGFMKIGSSAECEKAVAALGIRTFNGETYSNVNKPGGCWRGVSGGGNWNPTAGSARLGTMPVCKSRTAPSILAQPEAPTFPLGTQHESLAAAQGLEAPKLQLDKEHGSSAANGFKALAITYNAMPSRGTCRDANGGLIESYTRNDVTISTCKEACSRQTACSAYSAPVKGKGWCQLLTYTKGGLSRPGASWTHSKYGMNNKVNTTDGNRWYQCELKANRPQTLSQLRRSTGSTLDCRGYNFCAWTLKWNCDGQPAGRQTIGKAVENDSEGYQCCCKQARWKFMDSKSLNVGNSAVTWS